MGGKWRRTRGLRSRNLRSAAASNPIATALCRRMRRWTAMAGRELHEDSWAEHQRVGPRASCPAKPRPRDRARPAGRTADTVRRAERSGPRASARFGSGRQRSQLRRGRGRQQRLLRSEYGGRHARAGPRRPAWRSGRRHCLGTAREARIFKGGDAGPGTADAATAARRYTAHPGALSEPGALAGVLKAAGLRVVEEGEVACPFVFPSTEASWRGNSSAGVNQNAIHQIVLRVVSRRLRRSHR